MITHAVGEPSARIKFLKEKLLDAKLEVSVERARLVTQSYRETEAQPPVIRRAKALDKVLSEMTLLIVKGELIVGHLTEKHRGAPLFPEMAIHWLEDELDMFETREQDRFIVSDAVKEELRREIFPYWRGRTLRDYVYAAMPEDTRVARQTGLFTIGLHEEGGFGHVLLDFEGVLHRGLRGHMDDIRRKLNTLDPSTPEEYKQLHFLKALLIVCEAAVKFSKRYAAYARQLASVEKDASWQADLEKIAKACDWVPLNPARTFHEALQAFWFVELIPQIETNGPAVSVGRFDQYMYPFLERDLNNGTLSESEAQELLDCLWIKFNEPVKLYNKEDSAIHAGFPMNHNLTIGGVKSDGTDATNKLSYMCLTAHAHVHLIQPNLSVRLHRETPHAFLTRVAETIRLGGGLPQVVNDHSMIPALTARGIPLPEARNYAIIGCVEPSIVGLWGRTNGGYFNMAKVLELALNGGRDLLTGEQWGPATMEPAEMSSFEDVLGAYEVQMRYFVRHLCIENNVIDEVHAALMPELFVSVLVPDCIEKGKDVTWGGARYNWTAPLGVGVANVGNSLAAIKKVVFEDKKASMSELVDALRKDFEGYEELRGLLEKAPKYGNDVDYVDLLVRKGVDVFCEEVEKYRTPRGGTFVPSLIPVASHIPLGWATGASAEGRRARTPLADGISPTHGTDSKGPTAVLRSVSKLDNIRITNGSILNMKFLPRVLEGAIGLNKFVSLLRGFVELGVQHLQVNIVSADTLRDAQKHPERYRGLVVRVAGYSALFNELSKAVQDDIIERTEHAI